jgi:hypothetical protein
VSQICSAKSYEQMSCYEGLCELYRITGKREYLEACRKVADSIIRDELFVVGSGSDREVWCDGANKQARPLGDPTETCTAVTWLKLCFQLLRLTGDVQYADQMEICLYNAMLGAMKPDGSWFCRVSPLAGVKGPGGAQHGDVGLNCCVVNVPRALFQIPLWAVMTAKEGPVVNLYGAGSFTMPLPSGKTVRIVQETDFPVGNTVHISLHPAAQEEFLLRLRIPSWSAISSIAVNGTPAGVEVAPGTYAGIRRTWKDGDRVDVKLDMRGRLVKDPGGSKQVAVMRGPIVLAVDRRLQKGDGIQAVSLKQEAFPLDLPPRAAAEHEDMWIVAAVPAVSTASGKDADLLMCDYASAGNTWTAGSAYRVWLAERIDMSRPLSLDGARWIWHTKGKDIPPGETAAGTCCFRSELTVPEGAIVKTARAVVTADDRFVLYVNGVRAGSSDGAQVDWQTVETFDLTARIRPGRNVIAVEAENATPGPAGLIAKFVVTPEKGDPIVRVTGPDWKCTAQAGGEWHAAAFDDSNWAKAKVVGDFGCAPWGQVPPSE